MNQDRPLYGKATGNPLDGPQRWTWQGGVSGNPQDEANSDSQVDGDSAVVPTLWLCVGRAQKRNSGICQHFCLGENAPLAPTSALTLMLDPFSSSLYVTGELHAVVLVLELKGSESRHGPFERNYLRLQQPFVSLSHSPHEFS